MINDKMKIIAEQQSQRVVLKGKTIKDGNTIYSVKSPFTFKREIEYNNLSNVADFSNSQTDTRVNDNFNFVIYDFNNDYSLGGKTIRDNGFIYVFFTCDITSNNINFYHSGSAINIYILEHASLVAGHKYWCSFDCISRDSRVVGGLHLKNFVVIDLTQLYGSGNEPTTKEQFFATELGQAIRNGLVLPYSLTNSFVSGRNLFKNEFLGNSRSKMEVLTNGFKITDNDSFDWSISTDAIFLLTDKIVANKTYTISFECEVVGEISGRFYGFFCGVSFYPQVGKHKFTQTFTWNGGSTDKFNLAIYNLEGNDGSLRLNGTMTITNIQIELGENATPYEPYLKDLVFIRTKRVDLGTLTWTLSNNMFWARISDRRNGNTNFKIGKYEIVNTYNNMPNKSITGAYLYYSDNIIIKDTDYDNATEFKVSLSGVILEYETAEPLELNGIGTNYDTYENTSGKVVRKIRRVKINDLNWTKVGTEFRATSTIIKSHSSATATPQILCTGYNVVNLVQYEILNQVMTQDAKTIKIKDNTYQSVADFKSAKGNDDICYIMTTSETETERSVLVDHRYTKVVDSNGNEIDTD